MLGLAGCLTFSSVALLGEGFTHLRFFLPLAAFNAAVGAFTSERVARMFLAIEFIAMTAVAGYTVLQIHQRFPDT